MKTLKTCVIPAEEPRMFEVHSVRLQGSVSTLRDYARPIRKHCMCLFQLDELSRWNTMMNQDAAGYRFLRVCNSNKGPFKATRISQRAEFFVRSKINSPGDPIFFPADQHRLHLFRRNLCLHFRWLSSFGGPLFSSGRSIASCDALRRADPMA